jgi:TRAP-type C4-dicarboxylate transport system permease small subunit
MINRRTRMQKITGTINKTVGYLLSFLLAVMVLDVIWQVFTRFVLRHPSSYTEELAGFLLIWIGLLGASYAFYTRAHLGIDILTHRLQGFKRSVIEIAVNGCVLLFALFVFIFGGIRLVCLTLTLNQISPALGMKMGYVYLVIPLCGALFIVYATGFILEAILSPPAGEETHPLSGRDELI